MKLNIQLFASGTIEFARRTGDASWKWIQAKIEWTETDVDLTNNTSKLTVKLYGRVGTGGTSGRTWKGYVSIDGTKVINFTDMGSSWSDKQIKDTYVLFKSYTQTITHNSDGTKSVAIAGSLTGPNSTSISGLTSSGNGTATLDTIPRASEIDSITSGTTNFTPTLKYTPKASTFKYKVKYKYGNFERLSSLLSPGSTSQQTFTGITINSSDIGSYMPNVTSGTFTATLYTYQSDGTTLIGEKTANFTITLNSNVIPTISIGTPTENDSTMRSLNWGIYVKTKSKLSYSVSASGVYGSSVSSIVNSITGTTASGTTSVTTNYLTTAGTNTLTSKVTDSRGRSATTTRTINVVDYFSPTIQTFQVQRCDINGNLTDEGEYLYYNLSGKIASCSNHNTGTYKLRYKEKGTSTWSSWITLGSGTTWVGSGILQSGGTKIFFDDIKIYDIEFGVQDVFVTKSSQSELNSVADLMNFNPAGTSMAIGKVSQRTSSEKVLDIGLDTTIDKNLNVDKEVTVGQIKTKNLCDTSNLIGDNYGTYTLLPTGIRGTTNATWTNQYGFYKLSNKLLGKTCTFSCTSSSSSTNIPLIRIYYGTSNSPATINAGFDLYGSGTLHITNTFLASLPSGTDGIYMLVYANRDGTGFSVGAYCDYTNLQLEEGSQVTQYFPHQNLNGEDNYSTSEQRIGTWLGKPLYRKVIDCGALPNATSKEVSLGITGFGRAIRVYGTASNNFPIPYVSSSSINYNIVVYCTSSTIVLQTGSNRSDTTAYVVVEYTKITD